MKTLFLLLLAFYLSFGLSSKPHAADSPFFDLGPEQTLITSTPQEPHVAFPHAILDSSNDQILLVYRGADRHVGSAGSLWLAGFDAHTLMPRFRRKIFYNPPFDPRDPTLALLPARPGKTPQLLVSFFQYNYTTRLVQQFFLMTDPLGTPLGEKPFALPSTVAKSASSAPPVRWKNSLLFPVYVISDFFSLTSDVGIFVWKKSSKSTPFIPIAQGKTSSEYLLEPAIHPVSPKSWVSLFRTSPFAQGAGGLGPMKISWAARPEGPWTPPLALPWVGHHPRIFSHSTGTWVGFRDLSLGGAEKPTGRVLLGQIPNPGTSRLNTIIELMRADPDDPQGWDCGYVSWVGNWVIYYRNDRAQDEKRAFRVVARSIY